MSIEQLYYGEGKKKKKISEREEKRESVLVCGQVGCGL